MDERLGVQLGDVLALEAPMRAVVEALDPDAVFVFDAPAMFAALCARPLRRVGENAYGAARGSSVHLAADEDVTKRREIIEELVTRALSRR